MDTVGNLRARSPVGDNLDIHEIPSNAAIRTAEEQKLGRNLSPAERRQLTKRNVAVAIPRPLHLLQRTTGGRNTATQVARDAANLGKAALADLRSFIETAKQANFPRQGIADAVRQIRNQ